MSSPFNPALWYWKVLDSSPSTQVFSGASGSFVPLANTTYTTWLVADGGNVPSTCDTLANLYASFDGYNASARPFYQELTVTGDVTLTNPLPSVLVINGPVTPFKVILPPMNRPGSLAKGDGLMIRNGGPGGAGSYPFRVYYNDGTTITWFTPSGGYIGGFQDVYFTLTDNTTVNGTVIATSYLSIKGGTVEDAIHALNGLYVEGPNQADLILKKGAGSKAVLWGTTLTSQVRFEMALASDDAESTGNAGSNFYLARYADNGTTMLDKPIAITRSNGGVILRGTNTNDSAAAGFIGEFLEHSVPTGSKVSLTTTIPAQIATLTLTAGDWDVWGVLQFDGGGTTTITCLVGSIHTTTAALDFTQGRYFATPMFGNAGALAFLPTLSLSPSRFSVALSTAIYLNASVTFGVAACQAYGRLMARRRR